MNKTNGMQERQGQTIELSMAMVQEMRDCLLAISELSSGILAGGLAEEQVRKVEAGQTHARKLLRLLAHAAQQVDRPMLQLSRATLTACSDLCAILGGELTLNEEAAGEFNIAVTLPLRLVEAQQNPDAVATQIATDSTTVATPNAPIPARAGKDMPLSILLAEDSEVNRLLLQVQLEQLGYRTDAVANGEEVLRALNVRPYDVVLMDIRMPVLDGVETTLRLRSNTSATQPFIIAVTGSEFAGDQQRYKAAGIDAYLPKPVDLAELGAVLAAAYRQKQEARLPRQGTLSDPSQGVVSLNLAALYEQLGPAADDLLRRVIPVFIRELPARRDGLIESFKAGNAEAFNSLCHSLKGSSRSVGANQLAEEFARMEELSYAGNLPVASELDSLLELTARSLLALNLELEKLDSKPSASRTAAGSHP